MDDSIGGGVRGSVFAERKGSKSWAAFGLMFSPTCIFKLRGICNCFTGLTLLNGGLQYFEAVLATEGINLALEGGTRMAKCGVSLVVDAEHDGLRNALKILPNSRGFREESGSLEDVEWLGVAAHGVG